MSRYGALPARDYSVLTPRMLKTIQRRAKPQERDVEAEMEKQRKFEQHTATRQLVSAWPNTIARNRIDRQTRLQREKEQEEKRKQQIDEEERKIQKLKKEAAIAEAKKAAFMERQEVRAVNSQLLLNEVCLERQEQIARKEQQHIREMKRQMQEDENYHQRYLEMCEKEEKIKTERRQKAIRVAEGFKMQRQAKIEQKQKEREEDMIDELILARQMKRDLEREQKEASQRREKMKREMEENRRQNDCLITFKERQQKLEELEDQRIRELHEREMDEADRRAAEDARRKAERLNARQQLIEREARRQEAERKEQEDFLDKQIAEQYAKESAEVARHTQHERQIREERRKQYLEAMALKSAKEKEKRLHKIAIFPFDGNTKAEDEARERDLERARNVRDVYRFQYRQMEEKKERERAEKERERLEFNLALQKDQEELRRVQEYASKMLQNIPDDDEDYPI